MSAPSSAAQAIWWNGFAVVRGMAPSEWCTVEEGVREI